VHVKISSSTWLEKFKHKNNIGGRLSKKSSMSSIRSITESINNDSDSNSQNAEAKNGVSPTSPKSNGIVSPPMSASKSLDSLKNEDSFIDFGNGGYRHSNSQSTTSLSSAFTDTAPSSFSAGPTSPTSPFYSPHPDSGVSSFFPNTTGRPGQFSPQNPQQAFQARPRSQTFPQLPTLGSINDGSYMTPPGSNSAEPSTPKFMSQSMIAPPSMSSMNDIPQGIDETISANGGHNTYPMGPPPTTHSISSSPIQSSQHQQHMGSPINFSSPVNGIGVDAGATRQALEMVVQFFNQPNAPGGGLDRQEYMTIGKLMERLKLQQQQEQQQQYPNLQHRGSIGGLHRIEEHHEVAVTSGL
jgi:hypothetical protein